MQDPNPSPWGAMDRFQAHYIVRRDPGTGVSECAARTRLGTRGRFGAKEVRSVSWEGPGTLADLLNADSELGTMIAAQPPGAAAIYVEPTGGAVRIRSGWDDGHSFGITRELFAIYDRIAGHIRSV